MASFLAGEIVWAQYGEYPYWPGRIVTEQITSQLIENSGTDGVGVLFFGKSLSYALVPHEKIADFASNFERFRYSDSGDEFTVALKMAMFNDEDSSFPLIIMHRSAYKYSMDKIISKENKAVSDSNLLDKTACNY